jgi:hypothetical protein
MLHLVCEDNGDTSWCYDDRAKQYVRFDTAHNAVARIDGKYLPDPDELWQRRLDNFDIPRSDPIAHKPFIKPSPATFALWAHWQGVV